MADKTKIGRSRNKKCPYCDEMFYGMGNVNVHIAYKHPGEKTITDTEEITVKQQLKPYKKQKPTKEKEEREVMPDEETEEEDFW
jgi:hypothetical protein